MIITFGGKLDPNWESYSPEVDRQTNRYWEIVKFIDISVHGHILEEFSNHIFSEDIWLSVDYFFLFYWPCCFKFVVSS